MTVQEYKNVIDCFEPDSYMKCRIAARIKEAAQSRGPARRVLASVLIAAVVLICTMTAALAASPELRQAVLSFFHLEAVEQVPGADDMDGASSGGPSVTQGTVGDQVQVQYVQIPAGSFGIGNGTICQMDRAEDGSLLSLRFWGLEGGELTGLEPRESSFFVTWRGVDYQGVFQWCIWNGELTCHGDGAAPGLALEEEIDWFVTAIPGRTDAVLLTVSQGSQIDYCEHPYLYHLNTGAAEDLLAGIDTEPLGRVMHHAWSEDLSKAILSCNNGQTFWYCDTAAGALTEVGQLTGLDVFSAFFADDETLIILSRVGEDGASYSAWAYDLNSEELTQTLDDVKAYRLREEKPYGIQFLGGRYSLYVSPTGQVSVFDLKTGIQTAVEGFTFSPNGTFNFRGSDRALYFCMDQEIKDGLGVSQLGILDLDRGTFLAFDREGYDALHEASVSWFSDDQVIIWGYSNDSDPTYYLYIYQFNI